MKITEVFSFPKKAQLAPSVPTNSYKEVDLLSSLNWFDEAGNPKTRTFTGKRSEEGEWLYALSPRRKEKPLQGAELVEHLREIERMKKGGWRK